MEELLAAVAESMNAPASMVQRSAEARAKAMGASVEDVLRAWSGGGEIAAAAPPPPAAEAPPTETPAPTAAAPAGETSPSTMDEASIVAAAAVKMGMPESMVKRSAAARAKAQGMDAETVLREWAGIEAGAAPPAAPTATPAPAATQSATPAPAAPAVPAPAATTEVEVLGTASPREPIAAAAVVDPFESVEEAVAAGAFPRWLAALFVLVPAFALGYALFLPNGPNCGDAGSLAVDPVTGLAVNCDGSAFGSDTIDLFALGAETYQGVGCVACHGAGGAGVASFPGFTGGALLSTFPEGSCSAQIEWVALGSAGWPDATYGANAKPVGGSGAVMPGFAGTLSPQEIAAVSLYERVEFGGQELEAAIADCAAAPDTEAAALGE